ncbi:hypothetical protein [Sansalvadorimonas verongulae]|uniref:hypothetical protein n=1 Tax=Sansalvadorimonas verongulae TaxID=2172824 RepID=UPI0012BBD711|nr:hypothetical protein [Sansalvadorimonas verongulae]MTI12840.1 hypothetical protein [Sansalvadorimonas verongulae]
MKHKGLLLAALLSLLSAQTVANGAGGYDLAPPGYEWFSCQSSLKCSFLVPSGWSFERLTGDSAKMSRHAAANVFKYQILKERHGRKRSPRISINILQNVESRTGLPPKRHMEMFMTDLSRSSKVLETWNNRSGALISTAATSLHYGKNHVPVKKFNLLIANTESGTLYVMSFESMPDHWKGDWSVVEQVFARIRLDEEA